MNKIKFAGIAILLATIAYVAVLVFNSGSQAAHKIEASNNTWEQLSK